MRNFLFGLGAVGVLSLSAGCGDDSRPEPIDVSPPRAGSGGKGGGSAGSSSDDGGAGGAQANERAPLIEITSPTALVDPDADGVLAGDTVTVTCVVQASDADGASPLDESSVKLGLLDATGEELEAKVGTPTGNVNEYSNSFTLTEVAAGRIGFSCAAASEDKKSARVELFSLLDKGPTITFVQPEADSFHPLTQLLDLEFKVEAAPLAEGDEGAEVDSVTLELGGVEIELAEAAGAPGSYRQQLDLSNPQLFNPAPNGPLPIVVTATNRRQPQPVSAVGTRSVSIDGAGPVVDITAPVDKGVVGGKVVLKFTAKDLIAGVDPSTVVVSLNNISNAYNSKSDAWTYMEASGAFTFEFDSRQVKSSKVQITVNVTAKDKVGNISAGGANASEILFLDNFPPSVDLDPLNVRSVGLDNSCSISFDPVGDDAQNDLDTLGLAGRFRAVVWENTNSDPEIQVRHPAGTDPQSVRLYLGKNLAEPLLIDKDGDTVCDDVREVDSKDSLGLGALAPTGNPWYRTDEAAVAPSATSLGCTVKAQTTPDKLCSAKNSDMWQVVGGFQGEPGIYAASATAGLECTGIEWEVGGLLDTNADGWICLATRAVDYAGNVGVSRPLRICVDKADGITPPCANSSIDAPSCTDGCTAPPRWGHVGILRR